MELFQASVGALILGSLCLGILCFAFYLLSTPFFAYFHPAPNERVGDMDPLDRNNVMWNVYNEYLRVEISVSKVLKASAGDVVRLTRQTNEVANFEKTFDTVRTLACISLLLVN